MAKPDTDKIVLRGIITLSLALLVLAVGPYFILMHKKTADSPDGRYRACSGIRRKCQGLNLGGSFSFAYTTVELADRKQRSFGGLVRPKKSIFFCVHSKEVSSRWESPTTLVITAGCEPTPTNESFQRLMWDQYDREYVYQSYEGVEIKYDFKPEWWGGRPGTDQHTVFSAQSQGR
jgi:hypothetical protein